MDIETWCEAQGHNIIRICGIWCASCRDFPKPITYQEISIMPLNITSVTDD